MKADVAVTFCQESDSAWSLSETWDSSEYAVTTYDIKLVEQITIIII